MYLRKDGKNYSSYDKDTHQFQLISDLKTQYVGLAANNIVSIYETENVVFDSPYLKKVILDRNTLPAAPEPEVWSIDKVHNLFESLPSSFKAGSIQMENQHIRNVIHPDTDLSDLIINSYLRIVASAAPGNKL